MSLKLKSEDRYLREDLPRLSQGDILRDLSIVEWATASSSETDEVQAQKWLLPYVVVLSQECDLFQDLQARLQTTKNNQDKYLHTVLLAPAYPAASLKEGTHLKDMQVQCERLNSDKWRRVVKNNEDRYHFLPASTAPLQVPDLVLDFKHFLTAPRGALLGLKPKLYVASLGQLFRESLSQRFGNFLTRIALPDPDEEKQDAAVQPAPVAVPG
jgi:hypothetical protein